MISKVVVMCRVVIKTKPNNHQERNYWVSLYLLLIQQITRGIPICLLTYSNIEKQFDF